MGAVILYTTLLLFVCGLFVYAFVRRNKEKARGVKDALPLTHLEGMPLLELNKPCRVLLYPDRVSIDDQHNIALTNIKSIKVKTEKEITEKERSVIGRAIAGGLLTFNPVGAIVGGMSGVKNKKKVKEEYLLIISFNDNEAIFLAQGLPKFTLDNFANKVIRQIREVRGQ